MKEALHSHDLNQMLEDHGSPLNLLSTQPMRANTNGFQRVARERNVGLQIHFACKANKCVEFLKTANNSGIGIDIASEVELTQAIDNHTDPTKIICTAAIKPQSLVDRCINSGVTIVVDNDDEWALVQSRSHILGRQSKIAIRLGGFQHEQSKLVTRFGFDIEQEHRWMSSPCHGDPRIVGLQFHLDGPDMNQRVSAIEQTLTYVDGLRAYGHPIEFIDIGGGIPSLSQEANSLPVSRACNFTSPSQKEGEERYREATDQAARPLGSGWLACLLDASFNGFRLNQQLRDRQLTLHCEPGRSLLDGCGMTLARVEYRKQTIAGDWLIGLAMNHTQCCPTHDNELTNSFLLRHSADQGKPITGQFVGSQCTEHDFISKRAFDFKDGVFRGDVIVFTNTAAYQMHFNEIGSHGSPLAENLFYEFGTFRNRSFAREDQ